MKVKPASSADWLYGACGEREEPGMTSMFLGLANRRMELPPPPKEIEAAVGGAG